MSGVLATQAEVGRSRVWDQLGPSQTQNETNQTMSHNTVLVTDFRVCLVSPFPLLPKQTHKTSLHFSQLVALESLQSTGREPPLKLKLFMYPVSSVNCGSWAPTLKVSVLTTASHPSASNSNSNPGFSGLCAYKLEDVLPVKICKAFLSPFMNWLVRNGRSPKLRRVMLVWQTISPTISMLRRWIRDGLGAGLCQLYHLKTSDGAGHGGIWL